MRIIYPCDVGGLLITVLRNLRLHLVLLAFAGGLFVYLVTMDFGPGVSTDAVEYLSAAESFASGRGFINYKGEPYHLWSPFYPFLLAVPQTLFGIDPLQTGWVLNVIASGLIIWMSWIVVNKCVPERKVWAYLGALIILFSASLIGVAANIASDPIFIVMVLGFFLIFDRFVGTGRVLWLVLLTVVAGLASIQRYLGVTLIVSGFLGILYFGRKNRRQVILEALSFSFLASLPVVGWVLRNWFLTGTFFGVRDPSKWLLIENLQDAFIKIMRWFFPFTLVSSPLFFVALIAVLVIGFTRLNKNTFVAIRQKLDRPIIFIVVLFAISYTIFILILTKSEDHLELYDDRYYTPILIPLLILIFLSLQSIFFSAPKGKRLHIRYGILLFGFGIWMLYPVFNTYKLWSKSRSQMGVPHYNLYNLPLFRESPVTRELDSILPSTEGPIYSNYSAAVYFYTREQVASSPTNRGVGDSRTSLEAYAGVWPDKDNSLLVWYEPNTKAYLYTPDKLKTVGDLYPLFESRRGGIYSVDQLP